MLSPNYNLWVGQFAAGTNLATDGYSPGDIALISSVNSVYDLTQADTIKTAINAGTFPGVCFAQKLSNSINPSKPNPTTIKGQWRFSPMIGIPSWRTATGTVNRVDAYVSIDGNDRTIYRPYAEIMRQRVGWKVGAADANKVTQYKLEVVYKNVRDLSPGFKAQPFYYVAPAGTSAANVALGLKNAVDRCIEKGQLVHFTVSINSGATDTIILYANVPDYSINQRYEFDMIHFDASVSSCTTTENSVNNTNWVLSGSRTALNDASHTEAWTCLPVDEGNGYWCFVSDKEKRALGRMGVTNVTHFPVQQPTLFTKEGVRYSSLTIPYSRIYKGADNVVDTKTNESLVIYRAPGSTDTIEANIVGNIENIARWLTGRAPTA